VTPDTTFEIGSIGKTFTAMAAMHAVEAGVLDLHAPVTEYLPWFQANNPYKPITSHHLLTHSAGLISGTDFAPSACSEIWALRNNATGFSPGEHFYYSNVGYKVMGLVLEAVSGLTYPDIIQKWILDPLEMTHTSPSITNHLRPRLAKGYRTLYDDRPEHSSQPLVPAEWLETNTADGCIAATAEDMAIFARMLLNRGAGPKEPILTEDSFKLMSSPMTPIDEDWFYGYGLYIFEYDGYAHIGHSGDMPGYEAYAWLDMDNGLAAVVLETQPPAKRISFPLLNCFRSIVTQQPAYDLPTPPEATQLSFGDPRDYTGTYRPRSQAPVQSHGQTVDKKLVLTAAGNQLLLEHDGERIALEERDEDTFYVNHSDFDRFLLRFGRSTHKGEGAAVVEAFYGSDWYTNQAYDGAIKFEVPTDWWAYSGHYRAHNPWDTNFRIVLRKGGLFYVKPSGREQVLIPLEESTFRIGEDQWSPERIRFDQIVDGQAQRANYSGCYYYRFFTP
jgi:CubicO group peptidase (beta-lactamase class C family)